MILQSADTELTIKTFQMDDIGVNYLRWLNDKSAMRTATSGSRPTLDPAEQYLATFCNTSNQFLRFMTAKKIWLAR